MSSSSFIVSSVRDLKKLNGNLYDYRSSELGSAEAIGQYVLKDRLISLDRHVIPPIPPFDTIRIIVCDE